MRFIVSESILNLLIESVSNLLNKLDLDFGSDELGKVLESKFGVRYAIWGLNAIKEFVKDELQKQSPFGDTSKMKDIYNPQSRMSFSKRIEDVTYESVTNLVANCIYIVVQKKNEEILLIHDWLNSPHPLRQRERVDLGNLSWYEALKKAKDFHQKIEKLSGGIIENETGEIVITYPDGFYWIRLGKHCDEAEAKAMSHCGTGQDILYSLRMNKRPHVTIDLDEENGVINQIKGRANTIPKTIYNEYIIDFIIKKNVKKINDDYSLSMAYDTHRKEVIKLYNTNKTLRDKFFYTKIASIEEIISDIENNSKILRSPNIQLYILDRLVEVNYDVLTLALNLYTKENFELVFLSKFLDKLIKDKESAIKALNLLSEYSTKDYTNISLQHICKFLDYETIKNVKIIEYDHTFTKNIYDLFSFYSFKKFLSLEERNDFIHFKGEIENIDFFKNIIYKFDRYEELVRNEFRNFVYGKNKNQLLELKKHFDDFYKLNEPLKLPIPKVGGISIIGSFHKEYVDYFLDEEFIGKDFLKAYEEIYKTVNIHFLKKIETNNINTEPFERFIRKNYPNLL